MTSPGWYAGNMLRDYPFVSRTDASHGLPAATIVDFGAMLQPEANFRPDRDKVYLRRITRAGDTFEFEFGTTAPGVTSQEVLVFRRSLADTFVTEWQEARERAIIPPDTLNYEWAVTGTSQTDWGNQTYFTTITIASEDNRVRGYFSVTGDTAGNSGGSGHISFLNVQDTTLTGRGTSTPFGNGRRFVFSGITVIAGSQPEDAYTAAIFVDLWENGNTVTGTVRVWALANRENAPGFPAGPVWRGFLVTGRLDDLAEVLPSGEILYTQDDWVVEPGRIQQLHYLRRIFLANKERVIVTSPPDCDQPSLAIRQSRMVGTVVSGNLTLVEGFNCTIEVNDNENTIRIGGRVGGGAGRPTKSLPRYPEETPPAGSVYYEGGPRCHDVMTAINGVSARNFRIVAGPGIVVQNDPSNSTIRIRPRTETLPACPTVTTVHPMPPPPPPWPTTTRKPTSSTLRPRIGEPFVPQRPVLPPFPSTTTRGPRQRSADGQILPPGDTPPPGSPTPPPGSTTPPPGSTTPSPWCMLDPVSRLCVGTCPGSAICSPTSDYTSCTCVSPPVEDPCHWDDNLQTCRGQCQDSTRTCDQIAPGQCGCVSSTPPPVGCTGISYWIVEREDPLHNCRGQLCNVPGCECTIRNYNAACSGYCGSDPNIFCLPVPPEDWSWASPGYSVIGSCACRHL